MEHLQRIEIDWDIHKLIETERRSFDEPPYIALRRLPKLPEFRPAPAFSPVSRSLGTRVRWTDGAVAVPHGSLARMEYDRGSQVYEGQFSDGKLIVNGHAFDSLSAAANALAVTKDVKKTSLYGWNYWMAQFPGEAKWRSLKDMRNNPIVGRM
jgi:hypothetical protein